MVLRLIIQEVKAFLIALSLIFFAYVSGRYRYRVRDEVVNEQYLIEEIYEREIKHLQQKWKLKS